MPQTMSDTDTGAGSEKAGDACSPDPVGVRFLRRGRFTARCTVHNLARRTKLTTGAIYGHFRNKADLLRRGGE